MAGWRQALELALSDEEIAALTTISRSRTEPASRVERARMLLSYRENSSFFAVGRTVGVHHQTVQRCVERAVAHGPMAALDDLPRPGKQPTITAEAKAWVVNLACRKAKELGYPHELWTTRLLARHVREHAPAAGHICLVEISRPPTVLGSISSRASSPSSHARCCATSASHPNRNSRTASWLPWMNSTAIPSSTLGPISSTELPDMIRNFKIDELGQRFLGSNHIRQPRRACTTMCG